TSAFVGISIFFFSDLITVWSRVAQQPNSGLFPVIFGTCFLLAAIRRRSMFYFFLTGLVWGMGLILNILGPVIAGGVIGSILLFDLIRSLSQIKKSRSLVFAPCLLVSCGLLIASFPNLVQKDYYQALNQHVLHSKEDPGTVESRSRKTLQTNLMFLHFKAKDHFMWGDVVNPLTAFLTLLGFGSWKRFGWRGLPTMIYFLSVFSFLTAGLSHYPYLSVTWVLHGMLPIAILAAIGFDSLTGRLNRMAIGLAIVTVAWITVYNFVKMERFTPYQRPLEYISTFLKPVQETGDGVLHLFVVPANLDPYITLSIAKSYGVSNRVVFIQDSANSLKALEEKASGSRTPVIHVMDTCQRKAEIQSFCSKKRFGFEVFSRFETPRPPSAEPSLIKGWVAKKILPIISVLEK
ncbi:MAG: hypothetical protein KC964_17275, partial [Candidatus Omnitrophica bacterium]|nr:hypothetical protein [Candidatus Omnitrophota bacterium]